MIIGLTGRIGVGKSTASQIIKKKYNFYIIDLDVIGHGILRQRKIINKLKIMFGISIMDKKGIGISRAKLGNMVFSDSQRLKKLNEVVHPIIKSIVVRTIGSPRVKNKKVLIVGALIREIGLQAYCNKTAIIDASDEDIEREIGSRCRILEFQRSRDEYLRNADWVVVNEYNDDFYSDVAGLSLL